MSVVEKKQSAWQFIDEVFNKGNVQELDRFVTPDLIYHARGEDVKGVEKFKEMAGSDREAISDLRYTYVDAIAEGIPEFSKVAVAWIVEGTHDKEFRGIPATHKKFETVGISIFHFKNDKIKEAWYVADGLTPAIELGVVKLASGATK
jgi:steroid delta-isomerase-like uncharacterized protein